MAPTAIESSAYRDALLLSDADIADLVSVSDAIETLEEAFLDEDRGGSQTMQVTRLMWDDGRMQSLGGRVSARRCAAVKSWVVTERGAQPTVLLFSTVDGRVLAIMEAAELGRIRTGATSGVATRHLAREDARVFAVIGTGRQAMAQVAAALTVRAIREVIVAARDAEKTEAFARRIEERFSVGVRAARNVADAVEEADIVTAVTTASAPILGPGMIRSDAHVNAVGAVIPKSIEVDPALFAGADCVVVDSVPQVLAVSAEIRAAIDEHGLDEARLVALHALVAGAAPPPRGLTVFKSLGVGLADCAIAELAWRRAREGDA